MRTWAHQGAQVSALGRTKARKGALSGAPRRVNVHPWAHPTAHLGGLWPPGRNVRPGGVVENDKVAGNGKVADGPLAPQVGVSRGQNSLSAQRGDIFYW